MVTITRYGKTRRVTLGVYTEVLRHEGWELIQTDANHENCEYKDDSGEGGNFTGRNTSGVNTSNSSNENEDGTNEADPDLSEIPVSEMSVPQLQQYAAQLGVAPETVSSNSPKLLRRAIRAALGN